MKFIIFEAIYKERIWGGRRFEKNFGRKLLGKQPYGESWEIVDRAEDQSIISEGKWKGTSLRHLLEMESEYVMGPGWKGNSKFPILVKWLDCRERLSLQVHPPKKVASLLGGESKTENWYIAEGDPGASVFVGLKKGVTKEVFLKATEEGDFKDLLCELPIKSGDSFFIPSGLVHAIGGGCLILEIQENSDTTYRVYDWGRVDQDGKAREIHLKESMASINFEDFGPSKSESSEESSVLANCESFRIRKLALEGGEIKFGAGEEPRIISVVEGKVKISDSEGRSVLVRGANILLPYGEEFVLEGEEGCVVLVTDRFGSGL